MEEYKYINRVFFCIGSSSLILGIVLLAERDDYGLIALLVGLMILFLSSVYCCFEEPKIGIAP
jgi:hypothetical protein